MIELVLISFYVVSVLLCGYCYHIITMKELRDSLGIINAGTLVTRILLVLVPTVNFGIAVAYFVVFLYNTDIKIKMKDKNGNPN